MATDAKALSRSLSSLFLLNVDVQYVFASIQKAGNNFLRNFHVKRNQKTFSENSRKRKSFYHGTIRAALAILKSMM